MMVRVFRAGRSNGQSPVNYLLSDTDHTGTLRTVKPEVLEGSPATTIAVINSIQRQHKYVSGVIAFRQEEKPTRDQMHEVIRAFKKTVAPGIKDDAFNSLWVLHQEKGNTELHFLFAMSHLPTGRRWNPHQPGEKNLDLYRQFVSVMNETMGYAQVVPNPMHALMGDFEHKAPRGKEKQRKTLILMKEIGRAIQSGKVNNRDALCGFLDEELGVTVTRQGRDYLSVRLPGSERAMRLKGAVFQHDADYRTMRGASSAKPRPVMLTGLEFQQAKQTLNALVQERQAFNEKAYQPRTGLPRQKRGRAPAPATRTTTKEKTMPINITKTIRPILNEALTVALQADAERDAENKQTMPDKTTVAQRIASTRQKASSASSHQAAPSTVMDQIHELEAAIGSLQLGIDAATADIANAGTPDARKKAEQRLAGLLKQMARLQEQLWMARQRQLNEGGRGKKLKW